MEHSIILSINKSGVTRYSKMANGKLTVGTVNATVAINLGLYENTYFPQDAQPGAILFNPVDKKLYGYMPAANNTFAWAELRPA